MAQRSVRTNRTQRAKTRYVAGTLAYKQNSYAPARRASSRITVKKRQEMPVLKPQARPIPIERAYVVLFTICALVMVGVCSMYIREQAHMIAASERIAALQMEVAELTEKNDSAYNAVDATVNLETVREKAVNELGMIPVSEGSVVTYEAPENASIRQYTLIPKEGVLSRSVYR